MVRAALLSRQNTYFRRRRFRDSVIQAVAETGSLAFNDNVVEERWAIVGLAQNISQGSCTLLVFTGGCFLSVLSRGEFIYRIGSELDECSRLSWSPTYWITTVLEIGFLGLSTAASLLCIKRPRRFFYYPLLVAWYVYLIVISIPPFGVRCEDVLQLLDCPGWTKSRAFDVISHLDCSLQGQTHVQLLMAWILLTPRLLPSRNLVYMNWLWIFGGFAGTTVWYGGSFERCFSWIDVATTVLLLCLANIIAIYRKFYIEKSQRTKFVSDLKQREASKKMFHILEYMVPEHVIVRMLKNPGCVIADQVDRVSILFIMISDFDHYANRCSPEELLEFLNNQFTIFDDIVAFHGVTKIETVCEEYVAAVGVVPADVAEDREKGHQQILGRLILVASEILSFQTPDVKYKMGIHTGPVVAGVIGQKLPRFRLFGDTINMAARMMQKCPSGELQFGEITKDHLPGWVPTKLRGEVEMKGKGPVKTWHLNRDVPILAESFGDSDDEDRVRKTPTLLSPPAAVHQTMQLGLMGETLADLESAEGPVRRTHVAGSLVSPRQHSRTPFLQRPTLEPQTQELELSDVQASRASKVGARASIASSVGRSTVAWKASERTSQLTVSRASTKSIRGTLVQRINEDLEGIPNSFSSAASTESCIEGSDEDQDGELWDPEDQARKAQEMLLFEQIIQEMTGNHLARTGTTWLSSLSCLPCLGIRLVSFAPEMEGEWFQWFHESTICKKLSHRLDIMAATLAVVTAVETVWVVVTDVCFQDHAMYHANLRLPIFLGCRVVSLALIMAWSSIVKASDWCVQEASQVQFRLLVTHCVLTFLLFVSYDSVTVSIRFNTTTPPEELKDMLMNQYTRWDSHIFVLIFVLGHFVLTTQHPLLFSSSVVFVFFTIGLMSLPIRGLYFSRFAKVILVTTSMVNAFVSYTGEQSSRLRYKANNAVNTTRKRIGTILDTLMPPLVVAEIRELPVDAIAPSHHYRIATIAQSDLVGFTKIASSRSPEEVVKFIGELFGLFDELTEKHEVYKVETVGDAYIAGHADLPLSLKNSPLSVVLFGLEMISATHAWSQRAGLPVNCRVGVHSGECIGGIIGTEMQRYHLFGALMSSLDLIESTAPEGQVQISLECKTHVERQMQEEGIPKEIADFEPRRQEVLTTSKGEVHQFSEVGGPTYVVRSRSKLHGWISA